jgi:hypothetical protein
MRQRRRIVSGLVVAPWIVAGALLGMGAPTSAQDANPAPVEITTETPTASADPQAEAVGGGSAPSAMPSAGVGPGLAAGGTGPLSLGALVGAVVAAVFALRERLKNR